MFNLVKSTLAALVLMLLAFQSVNADVLFEEDVVRIKDDLFGSDYNLIEEAVVQLRWAGISDERIFDPLVEVLGLNKRYRKKRIELYVQAIAYSGNEKYLSILKDISVDKKKAFSVRREAKNQLRDFEIYQEISNKMGEAVASAKSLEESWVIRHRVGLESENPIWVRWAARDLFLHGYGADSFAIAESYLREHAIDDNEDNNLVDASAFLCKALGVSGNSEYVDVLTYVANTTPVKKLRRYAERSVQYYDRDFKAEERTN